VKKLWAVLKNKYLITVVIMAVWLLFFDKNDIFSQYDRHQQVKKLENEANYFRSEIEQNKKELKELQSDPKQLEKFAREHYLMKKDSEDIFVIVEDTLR
jgi:cell division protein FtsB